MARLGVFRWLILACALSGCATFRQDLSRGERHYDQSEYDKALATFRMLEADLDSLDEVEQSKYAYLRGMTDFRLGNRADARYWLGLAKASGQIQPGGLGQAERARLEQALSELNLPVYGTGFEQSLARTSKVSNTPPAPASDMSLPAGSCENTVGCPAGQVCLQNICVRQE